MKKSKILRTIVSILSCIVVLSAYFCVLVIDDANYDRICNMNTQARFNYERFISNYINIENKIQFPKEGEYYILGEQYSDNYYLAYAGSITENNVLLYGKKDTTPNAYWAIKINNGVIAESWIALSPLSEEQLLPYTMDEQKKQVKVFEIDRGSKIIGYWHIEEK